MAGAHFTNLVTKRNPWAKCMVFPTHSFQIFIARAIINNASSLFCKSDTGSIFVRERLQICINLKCSLKSNPFALFVSQLWQWNGWWKEPQKNLSAVTDRNRQRVGRCISQLKKFLQYLQSISSISALIPCSVSTL